MFYKNEKNPHCYNSYNHFEMTLRDDHVQESFLKDLKIKKEYKPRPKKDDTIKKKINLNDDDIKIKKKFWISSALSKNFDDYLKYNPLLKKNKNSDDQDDEEKKITKL